MAAMMARPASGQQKASMLTWGARVVLLSSLVIKVPSSASLSTVVGGGAGPTLESVVVVRMLTCWGAKVPVSCTCSPVPPCPCRGTRRRAAQGESGKGSQDSRGVRGAACGGLRGQQAGAG
jgi:hypothetical protein